MLRWLWALAAVLLLLVAAEPADAISPRRLVEVADFSGVTLSPDGRYVAYRIEQPSVERNTYDSVWYVQDMVAASPPLRLADGGTPLREQAGLSIPAPAVWSPDGRWIYYRALLDGRVDVWRAATDGSGAQAMTHDPANVRAFSLSTDGSELHYSVGAARDIVLAAEQAEYDQGVRIDRTVPLGQALFRSGNVDGRLATQRLRDNEVLRYPLLADVPDRWTALDLTTGERRELDARRVPPAPLASVDLAAGYGDVHAVLPEPAGHRIALITRTGERNGLRDRPGAALAVLPHGRARVPVICNADACRGKAINAVQWRPGTDEVLFTMEDASEGHTQSIHRWNVETGVVHTVMRTRGLANGGVRLMPSDCGVSAGTLACVVAEADRPPRLERIDIESGARVVLFDPNPALTADMAATRVRLLRWTDAGGQQFTGQFYPARHEGPGRPPLFVSYYWCKGFVRGGLGEELPFASLAQDGIAALCITLAPSREDGVEQYELGRSAVESVVALLAEQGEIDPGRVGMGGLSLGSEITMWTVMHSQVLTAASVSSLGLSPLYHLLLSNFGDAFPNRLQAGWQLGTLEETPERWRQFSPLFNLDRIRVPILMQLPEQEYIHSLDYAVPLMREGRADMYVFPHEPHQKFQPRHKLAVYERNLDWFRFWLRDVEDPDPAKREQYAHWRAMKAGLSITAKRDDGG
ncbi:Atxe2 family lasso peptide isopeptidase [Luteimonas terrae]|uniref:Dipeptidyl aminopeptidase/acylaminoacyl peptidase n=1 Tax=Luteimonas terrae TaxID=1530191 RepID=A0ABU1XWZ1_9GAMM|nr:Atxe2 family lasso peptide isopeptidase [Luteimonas terrae]MDR7193279.1 dipeptidyl aminopeptidase/acylaminoacyl peptidase [Luteimonas terrae]